MICASFWISLYEKNYGCIKIAARWKDLVRQGDMAALRQELMRTFTTKSRRKQALRKWQSYFDGNAKRMQCESFEARGLPCG
ncbi:MAG: hypothetical protein O7G88_22635 [bacterium]|nr:hypothetical protein [bacterium]